MEGVGVGELDSGAKILALSGIINYILADREMRQWFRFQIAGGGPGVTPDVDDGLGELTLSKIAGVVVFILQGASEVCAWW